jgi:AcrR family transcriptional regulator
LSGTPASSPTGRQRPSLREFQREQTLSAIHQAAVRLALDEGIAAATTDRIAADSGVSPRTLFNYYPVKEDAILGLKRPGITPAAAQRFAAAGEQPLIIGAVLLLADVLRSINVVAVELSHRRVLLERHPELSARLRDRITDAEQQTRVFLAEQFAGREPPPVPIEVVSGLAAAVIRYCLESSEFKRFPDDADLLDATQLFRSALDEDGRA